MMIFAYFWDQKYSNWDVSGLRDGQKVIMALALLFLGPKIINMTKRTFMSYPLGITKLSKNVPTLKGWNNILGINVLTAGTQNYPRRSSGNVGTIYSILSGSFTLTFKKLKLSLSRVIPKEKKERKLLQKLILMQIYIKQFKSAFALF